MRDKVDFRPQAWVADFCTFVAEKMFYKNCNFFESIPY